MRTDIVAGRSYPRENLAIAVCLQSEAMEVSVSQAYFEAASRRRSRLEVKISILNAINEGASRQTLIMNQCNLSWSFARTFIRILERQGLISTIMMKGKKNFAITERGRRALVAYTAVSKQLELGPLSETATENEEQHRAEITEAPSIRE